MTSKSIPLWSINLLLENGDSCIAVGHPLVGYNVYGPKGEQMGYFSILPDSEVVQNIMEGRLQIRSIWRDPLRYYDIYPNYV